MISVSKSEFQRRVIPDTSPDTSYLEQRGFKKRLAAYKRGEFDFVGVRAAVDLHIPYGKGFIVQRIESPGLWGIETDSGHDYLDSVFREECATLTGMLAELGAKVA